MLLGDISNVFAAQFLNKTNLSFFISFKDVYRKKFCYITVTMFEKKKVCYNSFKRICIITIVENG